MVNDFMSKELKPVPERIRVPVGAYQEITKTMDDFFIETKDYLEEKYGKDPSFEVELLNMVKSDNHITSLIYKDRCVAGVYERRTEFNNLEYIFFRDLTNLERITKQDNNS